MGKRFDEVLNILKKEHPDLTEDEIFDQFSDDSRTAVEEDEWSYDYGYGSEDEVLGWEDEDSCVDEWGD